MYDLGDVVSLSVNVVDSAGAAANATAVVCTVTLPDGTTATPDVTNSATGTYTIAYTPTVVFPVQLEDGAVWTRDDR